MYLRKNEILAKLDTATDEEREALEKLVHEVSGTRGWKNEGVLIYEDEFVDYAQDTLGELCDFRSCPWIEDFINWEAAAAHLRQDYQQVEFARAGSSSSVVKPSKEPALAGSSTT